MIHYFNPGHEAAVLNGSKYYQAPTNHVRMQRELAFLPVWYAHPDDFVLVYEPLPESFLKEIAQLHACELATTVSMDDLKHLQESDELFQRLVNQAVDIWGISPQACHFLTQMSEQHRLDWQIPAWKDVYRTLGGRQTAQTVLSTLIDTIPEIDKNLLPQFYSNPDEIEQIVAHSACQLVAKAPYSSSGKGLVWLPPGKMAQSERQILKGMVRKQSAVSLERALDKQLDFSMHFSINADKQAVRGLRVTSAMTVNFIGYSLFQTNAKGAYEKSFLLSQDAIKKRLTEFVSGDLLEKIQCQLLQIIGQIYAPHYHGNIGVDMLIYLDNNQMRLHPCVEINMRKSMGYLALRLFERFLSPDFVGEFCVGYHRNEHGYYFQSIKKC
ncbi:hypothetical protein AGMMS49525_10590 [Bacteroidia bacterium]|nr:hypothetical protein AGMMS49525_10590 [Bacteroidia bacterium]